MIESEAKNKCIYTNELTHESDSILNLKGCFKFYGKKVVLNGIDLEIKRNEKVAIIGVNGAGKTTLVEGIIQTKVFDSGTVNYNFLSKRHPSYNIGVQFQESTYPSRINVSSLIRFYRKVYDIKLTKLEIMHYLKHFNLENFYNMSPMAFSGGEKQRVNILFSILHHPELLILDELTTGLDIIVRRKMMHFIKELLAEKNQTLIMISHNVEEIDFLCNKFVIIHGGEIKLALNRKEAEAKFGSVPQMINSYFTQYEKQEDANNKRSIDEIAKAISIIDAKEKQAGDAEKRKYKNFETWEHINPFIISPIGYLKAKFGKKRNKKIIKSWELEIRLLSKYLEKKRKKLSEEEKKVVLSDIEKLREKIKQKESEIAMTRIKAKAKEMKPTNQESNEFKTWYGQTDETLEKQYDQEAHIKEAEELASDSSKEKVKKSTNNTANSENSKKVFKVKLKKTKNERKNIESLEELTQTISGILDMTDKIEIKVDDKKESNEIKKGKVSKVNKTQDKVIREKTVEQTSEFNESKATQNNANDFENNKLSNQEEAKTLKRKNVSPELVKAIENLATLEAKLAQKRANLTPFEVSEYKEAIKHYTKEIKRLSKEAKKGKIIEDK